MKQFICILLFLLLGGIGNSQNKKEMITLEDVQNVFTNMQANGLITESEFLYGYFFISEDKSKLEKLNKELSKLNFSSITIEKDEEDDNWWLSASRVEKHDANSLHELNKSFYEIADKYSVEYDGFDLGNADGKSGLEQNTYMVPEDFRMESLDKNNLPELVILNGAFEHFPHKKEFKYLLKFNISYDTSNEFKLPNEDDLNKLDQLEYAAEEVLDNHGILNYYVFRTTYNGERNFYIAVSDIENSKVVLSKFVKENKINLNVIEDENWQIYLDTFNSLPEESTLPE